MHLQKLHSNRPTLTAQTCSPQQWTLVSQQWLHSTTVAHTPAMSQAPQQWPQLPQKWAKLTASLDSHHGNRLAPLLSQPRSRPHQCREPVLQWGPQIHKPLQGWLLFCTSSSCAAPRCALSLRGCSHSRHQPASEPEDRLGAVTLEVMVQLTVKQEGKLMLELAEVAPIL